MATTDKNNSRRGRPLGRKISRKAGKIVRGSLQALGLKAKKSQTPKRRKAKIHKDDHIYTFIAHHPSYPTKQAAIEYYLATGHESAQKIKQIINEFRIDPCSSMLEFASGYGCVTRHLSDLLPEIAVTACDIHPAAIEFISKEYGVASVLSTPNPENLDFDRTFDVVFALSFFSHMPKSTWTRWLKTLVRQARPGGLVVFTTHGRASWKMMGNPELDEDGFWFKPKSEQLDLEASEYGTTITTPEFVLAQLKTIPETHLLALKEGFWWGHQDAYVVQRVLSASPNS